MKKYFLHSILIIVFVFSLYIINNSAQAGTVSMKDEGTSTLYSYTTSCSGSFKGNIGVIVPKGASSFKATYLYFHGNDYRSAKYICESYGGNGLCPLAQELSAPIIIPEIANVYTSFSKTSFQCLLDEAKSNLSTAYGINLPANYIVTGHSAGAGMINNFLISGLSPDMSIVFDGCYGNNGGEGNWCDLIADKSNSGNVYIYYATTITGGTYAYDTHPDKVFPFKVTAVHAAVPGLCFLDHINDDLCDGNAVYEGTSTLPTVSDISALTAAKATAQGLIDANAPESSKPGDHVVGSLAILKTANTVANATTASPQATVDKQVITLNTAISTYKASIVPQTFVTIPATTCNASNCLSPKTCVNGVCTAATIPATTTTTTSSGGAGLVPCTENCGFSDIFKLINNVVHFILFDMAIPIAAIMFAYAGFLLITSGGEASKKTKAKKIFTNVAIGLIIAVAAFLIIKTILSIVGYKSDWNWFGF